MTNPTLGTVGQADLINATGLPIASGVAGLGAGIATFLGTPSSANLRTAVTDETGTGSLVFANAPVLVAPDLGTPTFLVATNATGTAVGLTAGSAITNANLTGAVTSVGNATSLGSFTSAQLRTALTDETGSGVAVFATSPTITAPILNQINDTNNAQILGLSPTTSAVDYLVAKNGIGVGVPLHLYADGASANIGLHIQPKGTGLVTISDGTDFNKGIRFRSSGSAASAVTLLDAVSTAGRVVTLPDATTTLVGRDTTDTLTNKTIAFSSNTFSGTLAIANGGTNASTAASAIENLLPAYTGNGSKALKLNSGATALEWVADGGGTVTSVGGTGTVNGLTLTGTVTTSGSLTLGGTLDLSAPPAIGGTTAAAGSFTTLTTSSTVTLSGGTANGVTYLNGSKVLTSGSALQFDGSRFFVGTTAVTTSSSQSGEVYSTGSAGFMFTNTTAANYALSVKNEGTSGTRNLINFYEGTGGGSARANISLDGSANFAITASTSLVFSPSSAEGMRLTSTGLGIGTSSPAQKLSVVSSAGTPASFTSTGTNVFLALANSGATTYIGNDSTSGSFIIQTPASSFSTKLTVDNAGNLGLGVTPSAWSGTYYKVLEGGDANSQSALGFRQDVNGIDLFTNTVLDSGGNKYKFTGAAADFRIEANVFSWNQAASGTAGNAITFTQAATLTAGGNYLVGDTSDYLASRIYAKTTTTDNSTNALSLRNSANTELFRVRSDGYTYAGFYPQTTASAANVTIASGGDLLRSTSALKYKQDIRDIEEMDIDLLRPVRYKSKCANDDQTKDHLGLIADEAAEAGFEELVIRGADGEVEGFQYERLTVVLLKTVQSLRQRVATLEAQ
jgi:hypothetical protein